MRRLLQNSRHTHAARTETENQFLVIVDTVQPNRRVIYILEPTTTLPLVLSSKNINCFKLLSLECQMIILNVESLACAVSVSSTAVYFSALVNWKAHDVILTRISQGIQERTKSWTATEDKALPPVQSPMEDYPFAVSQASTLLTESRNTKRNLVTSQLSKVSNALTCSQI